LPIPVVQRYAQHGSFLEISGGSLFRSPGLGSWERRGHHQFEARFTFFLFNNDATFSRRGAEEVTTRIDLTGPDTFAAHATFDFFDAAGNLLSPQDGCPINENGRRFE
jgi:hypothetical protein